MHPPGNYDAQTAIPTGQDLNGSLLIVPVLVLFVLLLVSFVILPAVIFALIIAVTLAVASLILRHICFIVPSVTHEIDGSAASIVFAAMLAPVLLVTGRNVHVDWLIDDTGGSGVYHDGSRINDFRLGIVSDVNAAIKTGLADADRDTDIGCLRRDGKKDDHHGEQKMFHTRLLLMDVSCTVPDRDFC
jgi:hypothetical protein